MTAAADLAAQDERAASLLSESKETDPTITNLDPTIAVQRQGGPTIEIFLRLNTPKGSLDPIETARILEGVTALQTGLIALSPGRTPSRLSGLMTGAWTILAKRFLVARRSYFLPMLTIIIVICAACVPLFFIADRNQTCAFVTDESTAAPITYELSAYPGTSSPLLLAPSATPLGLPNIQPIVDNATLLQKLTDNIATTAFGAISLPINGASGLIAWEGTSLSNKGLSVLNLYNNILLNQTKAADVPAINLNFQYLASPDMTSDLQAVKWVIFFGLGLAIWPACAAIYPTIEKALHVRSNQYSNGARPAALWLGHLLFEIPGILFVSTVITIVFAVASSQFYALGVLWICLVLYGISSTIYAHIFALWLTSPLASWALVAGSNVILFLIYFAADIALLTFDKSTQAASHITTLHFALSLINPVPSIIRCAYVSINLFNLLCDGFGNYSHSPDSVILKFGGPITYMIVQGFAGFAVLVYVDSGAPIPLRSRQSKYRNARVIDEEKNVGDHGDLLNVSRLRKRYFAAGTDALSDVSFGVKQGETFALIGPNGAGKTTALACIRGAVLPSAGDVTVDGHSITSSRNIARSFLGVCPQDNAIDPDLTVRQHLWLYGRLKGVSDGALRKDIDTLLAAAGLGGKANQLAVTLSGGNQRKLMLGIALIGDRPVILIDEFSSGVDAFSRREAWTTLDRLTQNRVVLLTTHNMEEVDALANRVGILAGHLLAVGTPAELRSHHAAYELHLPADQVERTMEYLSRDYTQVRRSHGTATRITITGIREDKLERLLAALANAKRDLCSDMAIHEASTETAFLDIVTANNVQEEAGGVKKSWFCRFNRRA